MVVCGERGPDNQGGKKKVNSDFMRGRAQETAKAQELKETELKTIRKNGEKNVTGEDSTDEV